MSKDKKYMNNVKEINEEKGVEANILNIEPVEVIETTGIKVEAKVEELKKVEKKNQKFKVYSIVNDKAVMAMGLDDKKWYSKPNNNYRIGQIID